MPPGQVSRSQRATDLRRLGGSSTRKRFDSSSGNPKDRNSKPLNGDSSLSGSGNKPGGSGGTGSNGSNGGSQNENHSEAETPQTTTPPFSSSPSPTGQSPPPCFGFCVPDNDPRVKYSPDWSIKSQGFFSTSHATDVPGSWVTFNFTGSAITVFGSIPASNSSNPGPTAAYSIDAAKPFVTTQPMASQEIDFQPLFSASQLSSDTVHEITINVTDVQPGAPFTLDYLIFAPSPPQGSSSASESLSVSATAPATSSLDVQGASSRTNPFDQGGTGTTVAIVAVLGTVVFVLIVLLVLFLVIIPMRRNRARAEGSHKSSLFTTPESILRWSRAPSSSPRYSITSHFFNSKRSASDKARSVP
ncbi:hypothetical protein FB45DRAFT_1025927 [Roridomyces roridus]|uniref:Uncharacterized protein n=1 Tax=Roridomyces roridus TaxID=1738132 RepID=A0AAD7BZN5_9AGAR|nr:hypothetical protein FB45DRAFT_1025927 [Roridomyces roridus]